MSINKFLIFIISLCFISQSFAANGILPGSGTTESPYQIEDLADFNTFASDSSYWTEGVFTELTCDLDLSNNGTYTQAPIAPDTSTFDPGFNGSAYQGIFNGNDHTISYLSISRYSSEYTGLFGQIAITGVIHHLNINNANIDADVNSGILCGWNYGTLNQCNVSGTNSSGNMYIGGLCGINDSGTINDCSASITINPGSMGQFYGGLCGYNYEGTIRNSFVVGSVSSGGGDNAGGLCGANTGTIEQCYTDCTTGGGKFVGGLCGGVYDGSISECFSLGITYGSNYVGGFCGYAKVAPITYCYSMGQVNCYSYVGGFCGQNYSSAIRQCYSSGEVTQDNTLSGGFCSQQLPIATIDECYWDMDSSGLLYSDGGIPRYNDEMVLASSFPGWNDGHWTIEEGVDSPHLAWENAGGEPLLTDYPPSPFNGEGTANSPYQLTNADDILLLHRQPHYWDSHFILTNHIDMTGHPLIKSVFGTEADFTGTIDGAGFTIQNLTIDTNGYDLDDVGFVSRLYGTITNLGLTNVWIKSGTYSDQIGGLCGTNIGSITNCFVTGTIDGYNEVGGICGSNSNYISHCYVDAQIGNAHISRSKFCGGICGINKSIISKCYSEGKIIGFDALGGIAGLANGGVIKQCISLTSFRSDFYPIATDVTEGLYGGKTGVYRFEDCFWDMDAAGLFVDDIEGVTGLTTDQTCDERVFIDAGWSFYSQDGDNADWYMPLGGHPILNWQRFLEYTGNTSISLQQGEQAQLSLTIHSLRDTLSWTITGDETCSWITSVSPTTGGPTGSTSVTITIDSTDLKSNVYRCNLSLIDSNNYCQLIPIELIVTLNGSGTQDDPYLINNFHDFLTFADSKNQQLYHTSGTTTQLNCDLDLDPTLPNRITYSSAVIGKDQSISEMTGYQGKGYSGCFDGNNHTLSNLTFDINDQEKDTLNIGLFGLIDGDSATVSNLYLENATITTSTKIYYCGVLAGTNRGTINNCHARIDIQTHHDYEYTGGLCGLNEGLITHCEVSGSAYRIHGALTGYNYGTVTYSFTDCSLTDVINSSNRYVLMGGICGFNDEGTITNCYTLGSVNAFEDVGGLCGVNRYGIISNCHSFSNASGVINVGGLCGSNSGTLKYCFATGQVRGRNDDTEYLGGFCGRNIGQIEQSFSTGSVSYYGYSEKLGGFCGSNSGTISSCYSSGMITGYKYLGGFCGYSYGGSFINSYSTSPIISIDQNEIASGFCGYFNRATSSGCFWDVDRSGIGQIDQIQNGATGKSSQQMQSLSTFTDAQWTFNQMDGEAAEWYLPDNKYPILNWQSVVLFTGQHSVRLSKSQTTQLEINLSAGKSPVNWTITGFESCPWILGITPTTGSSTGPEDSTSIQIDIDSSNVGPASYVCNLIIATDTDQISIVPIQLLLTLSGNGTENDPYQIKDISDFSAFTNIENHSTYWTEGVFTQLNADIDVDPCLPERILHEKALIGPSLSRGNIDFKGFPYQGVFDGQNYTISNLSINRNYQYSYIGLFGKIQGQNAIVKNLILDSINIEHNVNTHYIAGLCGYNEGLISHITINSGQVLGFEEIALLCGKNDGTISQAHVSGIVEAENTSGLLCGHNNGLIDQSQVTGLFNNGNRFNGICCGVNDGTINNTTASGSISGKDYFGGFCGRNINTISHCQADVTVYSEGLNGRTGGFCGQNTPSGIFFDCVSSGNVETMNVTGGFCGENYGTVNSSHATGTVSGQYDVGGLCGNHLTGTIIDCTASGMTNGKARIGGLCGRSSSTIINCSTNNAVSGDEYVGGLCGDNETGVIEDSFSSSNVTGIQYIGGFCGANANNSSINNCYSTGEIQGDYNAGGFCGINYESSIQASYAIGNVNGVEFAGGFCASNTPNSTISTCYATGAVNGNDYLGGFVGSTSALIANCYALGNVSGNNNAGGFCGRMSGSYIKMCYSAGTLSGNNDTNGFCGVRYAGYIMNSFWDNETSPIDTPVTYSFEAKPRTSEEMYSIDTFLDAGWDFVTEEINGSENIWHMPYGEPGYPMLYHQRDISGDLTGAYGVDMEDFAMLAQDWRIEEMPTLLDMAESWLVGK